MEISVREAADRLGLDESRVRRLLRSGQLAGRAVGGRWLVRDDDVSRLRQQSNPSGRPMAPARAWALLRMLDSGDLRDPQAAALLPPAALSQVRSLARSGELAAAGADRWRSLLRARADVYACAGHPAAVRRAVDHPACRRAGAKAAVQVGADLIVVDEVAEVYLPAEVWEYLPETLHLEVDEPRQGWAGGRPPWWEGRSRESMLVVRVPRGGWPFGEGASEHGPLDRPGPACLGADLLESLDSRVTAAGAHLLARAARRLVDEQDHG